MPMENDSEKEILRENTMDDDELEFLQDYEIAELDELTFDEKHQLAETIRETGAELGLSGLTPDEYYDHGAEAPEEAETESGT